MPRLPAAAARVSRTGATVLGLFVALSGWLACAVDSSGLPLQTESGQGTGGQLAGHGGSGGEARGGAGGLGSMTDGGASGEGGSSGKAGRGGDAGTIAGAGGNSDGRAGRGGWTGSAGWNGGGGWTGSAGSNGGGGWTGSAGWNGNGGSGGRSTGLPMCDPDIKDNASCSFGTPSCRKTCGVSALATKACSCAGGQWSCGACSYPPGDYSCYELPSGFIPQCPFATMSGITSCNALCSLCSGYVDSTGAPKIGYCACSDDPDSAGHVYKCASSAEWPPQ
jgi:hypothetical protein